MASRDIVNNIGVVQLTPPANAAASPLTSVSSLAVDTQGFESVMVVVNIGTLVGVTVSNYLTLSLQESNTGLIASSFTNVAITANQIAGAASAAADFGDQNRPFATATPGGYPNAWLPAPVASLPSLYTGFPVINSSTQALTHIKVGYIGNLRYLRVVGTFTGAPTTVNLSIVAYLGYPWFGPVTSPAPVTPV